MIDLQGDDDRNVQTAYRSLPRTLPPSAGMGDALVELAHQRQRRRSKVRAGAGVVALALASTLAWWGTAQLPDVGAQHVVPASNSPSHSATARTSATHSSSNGSSTAIRLPAQNPTTPPASDVIEIGAKYFPALDKEYKGFSMGHPANGELQPVAMAAQECNLPPTKRIEHYPVATGSDDAWQTDPSQPPGVYNADSKENFTMTVTLWADSAQGWHELINNLGPCRLFDLKKQPWPGDGQDQALYVGPRPGTTVYGPTTLGVALRRVGHVILAGVYEGPQSDAQVAQRAKDLMESMTTTVERTDLQNAQTTP